MVQRRVIVHGRVQGVGFRMSVARRATSLGLAGWVRNLRDGSVEAVFEGAPDAVESLVDYCRRGPLGAAVSGIDVVDEAPEGRAGFAVE
jgi:acylphosphatase